jgi:hypothetical protein
VCVCVVFVLLRMTWSVFGGMYSISGASSYTCIFFGLVFRLVGFDVGVGCCPSGASAVRTGFVDWLGL